MNHYEKLGIPRDATEDEIRRAYRRAALQLHPDKNTRPGETELFLDVTTAYKVLSNPQSRAEYDAKLETVVAKAVTDTRIRVRFVHGRKNLRVLNEPQMHYMLLEILPPKKISPQRFPINLCVLIDRSTSMRGENMDRVRRATLSIIESLNPDDSASIVSFGDRAEVVVTAEQARKLDVARSRLGQIQAGGGTEIARGLEMGLAQVRSRSIEGSVNHLILITDGRTYGDEQLCMDMATAAAADRITINTVGIGNDWSDVVLDEVARLSGGNSIYLDSPDALVDLMHQIHHSLSHVAALQVLLDADMSKQASLYAAFRLRPDPLPLSNTLPMSLGHLPGDDRISILMEWMIDPIAEPGKFKFADFRVTSGRISTDEERPQLIVAARIQVSDRSDPDQPPEEVLSAVGALNLYRMQEMARSDAASGQVEEAVKRLKNLAKHLKLMGEEKLARRALSEASNLIQTQQLSDDGEKALKYGSRALLQLSAPVKR